MTSTTDSPAQVDQPDPSALRIHLATVLPDLGEDLSIERLQGGASNLTYLLRAGDSELILRTPPHGTKAKSAHDMGREHRVLSHLYPVFPYCPKPLHYCADAGIIGAPFFVMEKLEGVILRRDLPEGMPLGPRDARALCENLLDVHVELHRVDYAAAGLHGYGKPDGYGERQVSGWCRRYVAARTEDVPDNAELMDWLTANLPESQGPASVIHNDYKFDNVVLTQRPEGWRITGVLDWEMATIGDPMMDLGCSLAYWVQADDPAPMQSVRMMPTHLPGMMTRKEIIDYYCAHTALAPESFDFYYVFGLFRLAVIAQQIYFRFARGESSDQRFAGFGRMGGVLSERAWDVARGEASI